MSRRVIPVPDISRSLAAPEILSKVISALGGDASAFCAHTSRHFARVGARATEICDGWTELAMVGQRAGSWHGERWVAERSCSFRSLGAMTVFAVVPSAGILGANTFHPSGPAPHDKAL